MITDEMLRAAWAAWDAHPSPPKDNAWWRDAKNYDKYLDDQLRAALEAAERAAWQPVETAPTDTGETFLLFAHGAHGSPPLMFTAKWHPNGGWQMGQLREVTHWRPLTEPPEAAP